MDFTDELFQIADNAAKAATEIRADPLQKPLAAIERECEVAKRAWSGSNIGYHATVYFSGLQPKPPHAEFSPEWGLMDRWPTHQPDPGWQKMDQEQVRELILGRAGNPDIAAITEQLASLRQRLLTAKDQAVSILTATSGETPDSFIQKKLEQIDSLQAPEASTIAQSLLPRGNYWSRDSLAMTQGAQVAPHQRLIGLYLSATVLRNGLDTLEKSAREAASHLKRLQTRSAKNAMLGTNVFVGHGRSPLWRELKDFVEDRLKIPVDEFNSVPVAGVTTTARLSELLDAAAFAFLIMTAEDEQADGSVRARENVVHEVGLFQGRLGFGRAIVLLEEGCQEFSNIHGLGQIRFPKGKISAVFEDVRAVLEREGVLTP